MERRHENNGAGAETSPLLLPGRDPSQRQARFDTRHEAIRRHFAKWSTLYFSAAFAIALDIPSFMGAAPKLRMLELGLCREHYATADPSLIRRDGSIPEYLCKLPHIQSSLARTRGLLDMLEGFSSLVLAVPYGMLADRRGRRLVAALCLAGFVLKDLWMFVTLYFHRIFPARAVYAAPAMTLLGGGSTVISSLIMAMVAATIPEDLRSRAFFWLQVAPLITELVTPPVATLLMETLGPHLAFLVKLPIESLGFVALFFMPASDAGKRDKYSTSPLSGAVAELDPIPGENQVKHGIRRDMLALVSQRPLFIGLIALVFSNMVRPMLELTMQYMSVRYGWPLSQTSLLLSIQAAAQIPLFILILPAASTWLLHKRVHAALANLSLARVSLVALALGTLGMGISPVAHGFIVFMILYTLGSGYVSALRSFLASLVTKDQMSLLFTTSAVVDGVAAMSASPILQWSLSTGLGIGGLAVSLPYFVAACLYGFAGLLLTMGEFSLKMVMADDLAGIEDA